VPKIDSLYKHAGRQRVLVDMGKVKHGEFYNLGINQLAKNKKIFYAKGGDSMVQKLAVGVVQEWRKKMVQFKTIFVILSGR
jgi:hypothetical protein